MSGRTCGWTLLLVVGPLVATGDFRSPEAKKARYPERGDKYAAQEQYREAIPEYRNMLPIDPANEGAIRQLGLSYYQLGELGEAYRYLLKAKELAPDIRLKLGTISSLAASPEAVDAAIQRFEAAKAPNSGGLQHLLGMVYLARREPSRAEAAFLKATELESTRVDAYLRLGDIYQTSGRCDEALAKVNAALKVNPRALPAQMDLASSTSAREASRRPNRRRKWS